MNKAIRRGITMATKQQALAAIWKSHAERELWWKNMLEAKRREEMGEVWNHSKGEWQKPSKAKREAGRKGAVAKKARRAAQKA
jgi:hypothetical protein